MKSAYSALLRRVCIVFPVVFTVLNLALNLAAVQKPPAQTGPSIAGLYRGTLATQQIVLEVDDSGSGRYFYSRIGKAIKLKGARLPDGAFRIREYGEKGPSGAEWKLTAGDGGQISGSFCKCDVRQAAAPGAKPPLPISMTKAAAGVSYDDLLLDFPLQTGAEVVTSEQIAWAMQTDTRFKVSMPHITRFPDKTVMDKVNGDLAARLRKSRLATAAEFQGDPESGSFSEEVRVGLLSRDIFSLWLIDDSYSPGAAHPDGSSGTVTYNMHTGGDFDWAKFFRSAEEIGKAAADAKPPEDGAALDALHAALVNLALKSRAKPPEGCEDTEDMVWESGDHPSMFFDKDGLSLTYEMPHAVMGCGEGFIIPYSQLAPFVRKDSPLYSMVAGK